MELATLLCCILALVLLSVLLLMILPRMRGDSEGREKIAELERQIALLREGTERENAHVMDQLTRQTETTVHQVSALGDGLRNTVVRSMTDLGTSLADGQERQRQASSERLLALEGQFREIRTDLTAALDKVRKENTESMAALRTETRTTLDSLRAENQASMDKINATVNEKLQKTLNDRISQSFEQVNQRLKEVYEGLGEMKNVASGVSDLKKVLSNVKNRGTLGEVQLKAILEDILAPEQYREQCPVKSGSRERVDFAVRLPGQEDGKYILLPIDSKFPGDTYANLMDAYQTGNPDEIAQKRTALDQEIKLCAKSIQEKYISPPDTTDFAILFLPFEGLYAEVVNMGLVEILQRKYHVNIAGPSTMAAMLNSLQMGFRTLALQKKSAEVGKILEAVKTEFGKFEKALNDTRARLRQADEKLEELVGVRTRQIHNKLKTVHGMDSAEEAAQLLELPPNSKG